MLKGLDKKERKTFLKMLGRMESNLAARGAARLTDELDKEVVDDDDVE
jgi:hypothetical protein